MNFESLTDRQIVRLMFYITDMTLAESAEYFRLTEANFGNAPTRKFILEVLKPKYFRLNATERQEIHNSLRAIAA
jgi:hypothetical protein